MASISRTMIHCTNKRMSQFTLARLMLTITLVAWLSALLISPHTAVLALDGFVLVCFANTLFGLDERMGWPALHLSCALWILLLASAIFTFREFT